ncbi:zinc finger CCCH domain-containing protein 11A-like isoform X1 [Acipenser ruthenus]|uniref:zinc finger CCCH domain-containing protein 11A-like isoform X1 n=1 Tax=Acipenser ruthenus TaxID=7906 RepID=UPI002741DDB8|nr:zinc finger CCCH domain-containing protein 11A-like isoform X1 [Acipenser ruthenus]XP_058859514.1 zinc finger CCCH domain-containing protein 11A-like isoform X1 [Acipenser ruthenus]XP_058859515.1 zinc finger CCCH domain-containing protein 11A-like isoform X1 [Acipenser ruthenus]XP_058859516.1 zinc finger CCCH domain-containing protein 11A-like isoform X1 [Acipenser ruthenus]XP_058859517.1 zinc finger CCCH domain-containing protein 11A-like isoform X1 [Acipenser ruthenus]
MSSQGDDCYFFFYSTCSKGDSCPFRHCEAALGSETVCNLWQEERCFRKVCKFRHMEIEKKRNAIPCYWETQPAGCRKLNCAFHHEKSRIIDGVFIPASQTPLMRKEVNEEQPPEPVPPTPAPSNPPNPQLRGVIKAETLENVPSPTHPPVVINAADDEDEDDDDEVSDEGEDGKAGLEPSPDGLQNGLTITGTRKHIPIPNKDDSLNFGIKTLEEIRLRKALKANLRKSGNYLSGVVPPAEQKGRTGLEKEIVRSVVRPAFLSTSKKAVVPVHGDVFMKRNIAERLGKRKAELEGDVLVKKVFPVESNLSVKRCLAERLGRKVDSPEECADVIPNKVPNSMRKRLGLPVEQPDTETGNDNQGKWSGVVRIKTLEEIRLEKGVKTQGKREQNHPQQASARTVSPVKKPNKPLVNVHIKTSEIQHTKKQEQLEEQQKAARSPLPETAAAASDTPRERNEAAPGKGLSEPGEVRVKTLEEIRREKAARMQQRAGKAEKTENNPGAGDQRDAAATRRRILRINKAAGALGKNDKVVESTKEPEEPAPEPSTLQTMTTTNGSSSAPVEKVLVKSFEEIMREKRLRKQQGDSSPASIQPGGTTPAPLKPIEEAPAGVKQGRLLPAPAQQRATQPASAQPRERAPVLLKKRDPARVQQRATSPASVKQCDTDTVPTSLTQKETTSVKQGQLSQTSVQQKETSPVSVQPSKKVPASNKKRATVPVSFKTTEKVLASAKQLSPATAEKKEAVLDPVIKEKAVQPPTGPKDSASPVAPEEPQPDRVQQAMAEKPALQAPEPKVRPKLNVKPSMMKPTSPVRLGQKRKAPESHPSAIAAVKPMNSAPSTEEEQEPPHKQSETVANSDKPETLTKKVCPSEPHKKAANSLQQFPLAEAERTQPAAVQGTPAEEPQRATESVVVASPSAHPQRPAYQARTRRLSSVSSRAGTSLNSSAAVDDFEELMKEFSDDRLEDEIELDPAKGEDDLLLELSEMIGS